MVKDFISSDEHRTMVMPDRLMINQCFYHFKELYQNLEKKLKGKGISTANPAIMAPNGNVENQSNSPTKVETVIKADPMKE